MKNFFRSLVGSFLITGSLLLPGCGGDTSPKPIEITDEGRALYDQAGKSSESAVSSHQDER